MDNETAEPSIAELRGMLITEPAAEPKEEATETPAPAAQAEEKPAPASEPVEDAGKQRGPDGKFVAAEASKEDPPGVAKRIGKALEAQRLAEERATRLEEELARAKPGSQPAQETAPPAAVTTKPKPAEKDFDSYAAYVEALTDWKIDNQRAIDVKAANDRAVATRQAESVRAWNERVVETVKVHPDYEAVMADVKEIPITLAMHDAILTMARGPEVAYFLAKHLDECERISKLGPSAAGVELGEIRASLGKPAAAAPAAGTKPAVKVLPKPAAAVGGSAAPHTIDLNDPDLDMKKFKSEFEKRLKNAA